MKSIKIINNKVSASCLLLFGCLSVPTFLAAKSVPGVQAVAPADPEINVSGVVLDADGEPLLGALVKVDNSVFYTMTNDKGYFNFQVPSKTKKVSVSYIGLKTQDVELDDDKSLTVRLELDGHRSDEVLRLAQTQTSTREALTGSISTVDGEKLLKTTAGGFTTRLEGVLPGLTVISSSSDPGYDGSTLFIRGRHSLNGNDPLIVLDGIPSPTTDINTLDPNSIESVSILKDAAATAVYGYQATNGAILINTKRGFIGKTRINATADFSIQQATVKPHLAHSWEYAMLRNEALRNDGLPRAYSDDQINNYYLGDDRLLYPDNNWYNLFTNNFAAMQRYNVNASGGNSRVRYFINGTYMHQGNLLETEKQSNYNPNFSLKRFNIVSNMDVTLLKNLTAFLNANINIDNQNAPNSGDYFGTIFRTPALQDGPLTPDGHVIASDWETNPVYGRLNKSGYISETRSTVNVSFGMDWGLDFIAKGLKLSGKVGYESRYLSHLAGSKNYARYIRDDQATVTEPVFIQYGSNQDQPLSFGQNSNFRYFLNFLGTLSYDRSFGKHDISAYVNYFYQNYMKENFDADGMLPFDRVSIGLHAKYGYDKRYYIEFNGSDMGSEQFAHHHRFGFFPTVSGSWVASNEKFIKNSSVSDWLTLLKIRASYGVVGNDNISGKRFLYKDQYINGAGGYIQSIYGAALINEGQLGNIDLSWERSRQLNLGLDIGFFNSLTLSFDYYHQKNTDIVLQSQLIPNFQGISRGNMPFMNVGEVKDQGFELQIQYDKKFNKDLSVTASAGLAYNKNKVINAGEINRASTGYYYPYRTTGYSIGQSWGYLIDRSNGNGFFNSQEEIQNSHLTYEGTQPRVGDFIYKDLNGDGIINEKDQAPIGDPDVPKISYDFDAQITYKGFDFYFQFQGIGGRSLYNSGLGVMENDGHGVYMDIHKNAWTAERYANGDNITYPALSTIASSSLRANDFFITDRNFLRLKNLELGYTLPAIVSQKLYLQKARIYINATNLFTIDNMRFEDIDPEANNLSSYPVYRTFNIGVSLTF